MNESYILRPARWDDQAIEFVSDIESDSDIPSSPEQPDLSLHFELPSTDNAVGNSSGSVRLV